MKNKPELSSGDRFIFLCLLSVILTNEAGAQIYTLSAPVSGRSEVDLSFGPGSSGSMRTSFGTLTETLYYDPFAQTLRQVGSVNLNPPSGSFSMEYFAWLGPSSSPPTGTAKLTIGLGTGLLTFDSGTQPVSPGANQCFWTLSLPVSGVCTIVNNGQTNSGLVNYSVDLSLATIVLSASPTNLVISESATAGAIGATKVADVGGVALYNGTDDNIYYYSWNLGSVTATPTPEPGSLVLLGFGATMLAFLRRRQR